MCNLFTLKYLRDLKHKKNLENSIIENKYTILKYRNNLTIFFVPNFMSFNVKKR